ncbi:MAG: M55 family metallopeptidase [Bacillota bacterium]|jgi:D-amino peptidase
MKVYISADMEGITGVSDWSETEKGKPEYEVFARQMTREVRAACIGALKAGAREIWVQDAHETGRNINGIELPEKVRLIRGWSGHPFAMVQELDETFEALVLIGYHSGSGLNSNPLSHTMHASNINYIKINEQNANEFMIHCYAAASVHVPVIFVSGDKGLCNEVKKINNNIVTTAVKEGIGNSTVSMHPDIAVHLIETGVVQAFNNHIDKCKIELPEIFNVEISFVQHTHAYRASFYPGMKQLSSNNVVYRTKDFFDVLRMMLFVI